MAPCAACAALADPGWTPFLWQPPQVTPSAATVLSAQPELNSIVSVSGVWQLVVHPEWNAGTNTENYRELSAYVRVGDEWRPFNREMHADQGPDAGLLDEGLAGLAMAFYNHIDDYGLLMRYSTKNIRKLRTWWVPGYRQINLELETERLVLEPGESFEISYSFEPWDGSGY